MALSNKMLNRVIIGLVLLTILFQLAAELVPVAQTAGNDLNSSGVPLGALFVGGGVVFVIIMAAILITVVKAFMPKN